MTTTKKKKMTKPAMERLVREFHKGSLDKDLVVLGFDKRRRAFADEKGMTTRQCPSSDKLRHAKASLLSWGHHKIASRSAYSL
jgi:methylphosphotriester-DNA--protein-cysteine methyltransferase